MVTRGWSATTYSPVLLRKLEEAYLLKALCAFRADFCLARRLRERAVGESSRK